MSVAQPGTSVRMVVDLPTSGAPSDQQLLMCSLHAQLSDPSHAKLEALLWTADANTSVVCGPSGNVTLLAASMLAASNAPAGELFA